MHVALFSMACSACHPTWTKLHVLLGPAFCKGLAERWLLVDVLKHGSQAQLCRVAACTVSLPSPTLLEQNQRNFSLWRHVPTYPT